MKDLKSGPVVFSNGQRGVFITEQDIGRSGDAFQWLSRIHYKDHNDLFKKHKMIEVMWFLKSSQSCYAPYEYVDRQYITIEHDINNIRLSREVP